VRLRFVVRDCINEMLHYLATSTNEERLEIWSELQKGYCKYCGRKLQGDPPEICYCEVDEPSKKREV
jgi:hypothetical protein